MDMHILIKFQSKSFDCVACWSYFFNCKDLNDVFLKVFKLTTKIDRKLTKFFLIVITVK